MAPRPFVLEILEVEITDLKTRLGLTRFPDVAPGEPWAYGSSVPFDNRSSWEHMAPSRN
jgi:hypothetical protein